MKKELVDKSNISTLIFNVRNENVIFDFDLAKLYGYEVKAFNQQVKRNIKRFPSDFMFQINIDEIKKLKSHFVTSKNFHIFKGKGGNRRLPYAFTEQGIYMLSTVLKGDVAVKQSIYIMRAFKELRHFVDNNLMMLEKIKTIELKQIEFEETTNNKIANIYKAFNKENVPNQKIFYKGQIFDAYILLSKIINLAKKEIILVDNYINIKTFDILSKKQNNVDINIYTTTSGNNISKHELDSFKKQYGNLNIYFNNNFHDRFLLIDKITLYHIGASIKDAGNKCFAITKIEDIQIISSLIKR